MKWIRFTSLVVLLAGVAAPCRAQMPWHAPGWTHRARVEIHKASSDPTDVAAVRILHGGTASPSGEDYRLLDAQGQALAYEITYHHPQRDTLISFRCPHPKGQYLVYWGNPQAGRDPMRAIVDPRPGSGPPKPGPGANGWIPRAGLVLTTLRRPPEADNPQTIQNMARLIEASADSDGAGYQTNLSHAVNPHGNSDYYLSIYRGWLRLASDGTYGFCTASNEASFSFINGRELVHWPGRHTEQRGRFGQKNAEHQISAGVHYIEYYHEEVLLYQVAFLGYKPPGTGHYVAIPKTLWVQPHQAQVTLYELAGPQLAVSLRPKLLDSVWPQGRPDGQFTRYQFTADPGNNAPNLQDWIIMWNFGDGLSARGAQVQHVYLKTGGYQVQMIATGPGGQRIDQRWALTVYPIEHLTGGYQAGKAADYVPIVRQYDRQALNTASLAELARFEAELGEQQAAMEAAKLVIARGDAELEDQADAHWIAAAADSVGRLEHLESALQNEADPIKRLRILSRLILVFGVERHDAAMAESLFEQARHLATEEGLRGKIRSVFRDAAIAAGDAQLAVHDLDLANERYRLAESLTEPPPPPSVRKAKIAAYYEAMQRSLQNHKLDEALAIAERWRTTFPLDQSRGEVLFWIGKLKQMREDARNAIRPLRLAIELAEGAAFEAEARYRLAQAYRSLGDEEAWRGALTGLIQSGLSGPYRELAVEELSP